MPELTCIMIHLESLLSGGAAQQLAGVANGRNCEDFLMRAGVQISEWALSRPALENLQGWKPRAAEGSLWGKRVGV